MKLVIVESPAKCETIKRYLGDEYIVDASLGHICDLATSGKGGLGVDVEHDFAPKYVISANKKNKVDELIQKAKACDEVILATDPDREGEAIAWHLARTLGLDVNTCKRLEFHEITRDSITEAIAHPRTINLSLVSSQETRRILDRIIGFKLSGFLYKKIKSKSGGRVQSATLKLITDHEKEINEFVSEEYYVVNAKVEVSGEKKPLDIVSVNGKPFEIKTKENADYILSLIDDKMAIKSISTKMVVKESKEPFTTSTLQQEAFNRLKFKTKRTQAIAQKLYEGINVGDEHMGLITYMRTDSTRLSPIFVERCSKYIIDTFGKEYLGHQKKIKQIAAMQDAHEAIRPTANHRTPESVKPYLKDEEYALYKLIYNRALSSLMKPKTEEVMTITLSNGTIDLKFDLARTVFKGYEVLDEKPSFMGPFPDFHEGDLLSIVEKNSEQKFTQPPARYTEAKVVKLMEEDGIGRPSTYAVTIDTLYKRGYTKSASGAISATDQGIKTIDILDDYFPDIVDVKYTAQMEEKLDGIAKQEESRNEILSSFYDDFTKQLENANERVQKEEGTPKGICPKCGGTLLEKQSKHGTFIGCSNYPKCKYIVKEEKEAPKETGELCPKCGKPLVERKSAKGTFIGCSGYPACNYIKPLESVEPKEIKVVKPCPKCGGNMYRKKGKYGFFLACSNYPNCKYMEKITNYKKYKK